MQPAGAGAAATAAAAAAAAAPLARAANGLFSLVLAVALLAAARASRGARSWRALRGWARALIADYGCPLAFVACAGLSYALRGVPGAPRRVAAPDIWASDPPFAPAAARMAGVPPAYIAAALLPAVVIAVLFYFDHNVSSQLAQQPEFGLAKPPAYHYDLALLAVMVRLRLACAHLPSRFALPLDLFCPGHLPNKTITPPRHAPAPLQTLALGLLGLPPINGVLPQAPMHTRALARLKRRPGGGSGGAAAGARGASKGFDAAGKAADASVGAASGAGFGASDAGVSGAGSRANLLLAADGFEAAETVVPLEVRERRLLRHHGHHHSLRVSAHSRALILCQFSTTTTTTTTTTMQPAPPHTHTRTHTTNSRTQTDEQRLTNLAQSLLCAACVAATPAIRAAPTAALWGYFAFMSLESLEGSQLAERALLLLADPKRRARALEAGHAAYLDLVPFGVVAAFTLLQLALLAGVWALTAFGGPAAIAFPLPIMALVPLRQFALPRLFRGAHLRHLDAAEFEEAPPRAAGGGGGEEGGGGGGDEEEEEEREALAGEFHGLQPVHHLSAAELRRRRQQQELQDQQQLAAEGEPPLSPPEARAGRDAAAARPPAHGDARRRRSHEV